MSHRSGDAKADVGLAEGGLGRRDAPGHHELRGHSENHESDPGHTENVRKEDHLGQNLKELQYPGREEWGYRDKKKYWLRKPKRV